MMGDKSNIEWTEATWNPIVGCSVVSPGCTNCYAMRMAYRLRMSAELKGSPAHYLGTAKLHPNGMPIWTGKVALAPDSIVLAPLRRRGSTVYFVNSMGDLFHEDVPDAWIDRVFAVMALAAAPKTDEQHVIYGYSARHSFLALTKRSGRARQYVSALRDAPKTLAELLKHPFSAACREVSKLAGHPAWMNAPFTGWGWVGAGFPGFCAGVSVERQQEADERVPDLLATPAALRFVSVEPMLGPIDLDDIPWPKERPRFPETDDISDGRSALRPVEGPGLDGVIVGGESGPQARPMHPDWPRAIRDQCAAARVPFFFKQWGEWIDADQWFDLIGKTHLIELFEPNLRTPWKPRRPLNFADAEAVAKAYGARFEHQSDGSTMIRVGRDRAGRFLDGIEHNELPWSLSK